MKLEQKEIVRFFFPLTVVENNFSFWFMLIWDIFQKIGHLRKPKRPTADNILMLFIEARELVAYPILHNAGKSPISRNIGQNTIFQNEKLFFTIELVIKTFFIWSIDSLEKF